MPLIIHPQQLVRIRAELAKRERARRHFLPFCQYIWPGFEVRPYRALIASALEGALERRWTRLMIFVPPQYGKSFLVSRHFPAWWLGRLPDQNVIQTSYAASLAFGFSRSARGFVRSPEYSALFGPRSIIRLPDQEVPSYYPQVADRKLGARAGLPVELAKDSQSVEEWRLQYHRGGLAAAGVGGGITGKSAYLANIDDPIKDATWAASEVVRDAQQEWYQSALYTRLAPNGVVVLCMTRWHEADLAGWLLQAQADGGDPWTVLRLPALAETPTERKDWLDRNNVTPDRYLIAGFDPQQGIVARPWTAAL